MSVIGSNILAGASGGAVDVGTYFLAILGGDEGDAFEGVAVDSSDNIYVSGDTRSADVGIVDVFVASYDKDGSIRWQKSLAESGSIFDAAGACAVDSSDNLYISCLDNNQGNRIVKLNSSGTLQYDKVYKVDTDDTYRSIAVDGSDNVYSTYRNGGGFFVTLKTNSSGTLQFCRKVTDTASMFVGNQGCAVDSSGNSYSCGQFDDDDNGTSNPFIYKYNASGTIQWQKVAEGDAGMFNGVETDGTNVYAAGYTQVSSVSHALLIKYNTSGAIQWQKRLGDGSKSHVYDDVALDSDGNIYCTGLFTDSSNDRFAFIVKYNSSGTVQWQRSLGRASYDTRGNSITVDSTDQIIVVGETDGVGPGNDTGFILRIPNDGSLTGTYNNMTYASTSSTAASTSYTSDTTTATEAAHSSSASDVTGKTLAATSFTSSVTDIE